MDDYSWVLLTMEIDQWSSLMKFLVVPRVTLTYTHHVTTHTLCIALTYASAAHRPNPQSVPPGAGKSERERESVCAHMHFHARKWGPLIELQTINFVWSLQRQWLDIMVQTWVRRFLVLILWFVTEQREQWHASWYWSRITTVSHCVKMPLGISWEFCSCPIRPCPLA